MHKRIRHFIVLAVLAACAVGNYGLAQSSQLSGRKNGLLYWATQLQQNISPANTKYTHQDNMISWGDDGSFQCYEDCSGFINALIARSYSWTDENFKTAFGHKRMYAYHYYDAIISGRHFQQIKNINAILPGDIIALEYADRSEHEDNTGHVMLIVSLPGLHKSSKIIEPGTTQYEVEVIDCSKSPHEKSDTRFAADGSEYSGLGKGLFRLYADNQGNVVAYSWSAGNPKADFNPFENPVVIGRFL